MADMKDKQIFGYTEANVPGPGTYVKFMSAHEREDGIIFSIRMPDGSFAAITLPDDDATELALKVLLSGRCRELAYAKIPHGHLKESDT